MNTPILSRRAALQRIGAILGAPLGATAAAAFLAEWATANAGTPVRSGLSAPQQELLATLVELIIPTTDTPGAIAAGADVFIERVLSKLFNEEQRAAFLAGLVETDRRALTIQGVPFVKSRPSTQTAVLQELESQAAESRSSGGARPAFFNVLKELTLTGYYTSEIGATRELKYVHVAGAYDGDVPFEKIGRAYAD